MFPVRIMGTSSRGLGDKVTTRSLIERALPDRDPEELESRIGIATRHWLGPVGKETTRASIAAKALQEALDDAGLKATDLERIIYISATGPDCYTPATACTISKELGLDGTCDCFDVANACMGFMTGLDIAARSITTGMGPIGLVALDLLDPYLIPEEYRTYLVFGSAVAAAVLGPAQGDDEGFLSIRLSNNANHPSSVIFSRPEEYGDPATQVRFVATSKEMKGQAIDHIIESAHDLLEECGVTMDDFAWVLPHQPNGRMFDTILERLGVPEEKAVRVVDEIGSVASVSIPFSLDRLRKTKPIKPGELILIVGVGAGVSYGATIYRVGPE